MRDPNRIDPILARLRAAWIASPDLRLGQLLVGSLKNPISGRYPTDDAWMADRMRRLFAAECVEFGAPDAAIVWPPVDRPAPTPTPAPGLDLDAVEWAERAMTPGPWVALPRTEGPDDVAPDGWLTWFEVDSASEKCVAQCASASGSDEANAAGIVTLRNAAPALIAEVRALRAMVERHGEHLRAGADAVRSANASTAEIGARMEAAGEEIEALRAKLAEATSLLRSAGDLFVEIQATDGEDEHKAITDGAKLSAAISAALEAL